ncbi:conserved hypothetical protein [delta proteobacterium NaphS2]|nr:conserved hypothetical protein [delta proteobacterium NaphS2]
MPDEIPSTKEHNPEALICCRQCRHFSLFENSAGHNSPHALGECGGVPWDGSLGQWAMFQHHCTGFEAAGN